MRKNYIKENAAATNAVSQTDRLTQIISWLLAETSASNALSPETSVEISSILWNWCPSSSQKIWQNHGFRIQDPGYGPARF